MRSLPSLPLRFAKNPRTRRTLCCFFLLPTAILIGESSARAKCNIPSFARAHAESSQMFLGRFLSSRPAKDGRLCEFDILRSWKGPSTGRARVFQRAVIEGDEGEPLRSLQFVPNQTYLVTVVSGSAGAVIAEGCGWLGATGDEVETAVTLFEADHGSVRDAPLDLALQAAKSPNSHLRLAAHRRLSDFAIEGNPTARKKLRTAALRDPDPIVRTWADDHWVRASYLSPDSTDTLMELILDDWWTGSRVCDVLHQLGPPANHVRADVSKRLSGIVGEQPPAVSGKRPRPSFTVREKWPATLAKKCIDE